MEIRGTFSELVIQCLDLSERTDVEPMQLYVEDVPVVTVSTPSILCNEARGVSLRSLSYEKYRYVLMLHQVRQVLNHWRMQNARELTPDEACCAVMYYSENDEHLPRSRSPAKHSFVWKVGHKRGDS